MHPQSTPLLTYVRDLTASFAERFWSHVDTSGGSDACWPWLLRLDRKGYGNVSLARRGVYHQTKAHRAAFLLARGVIDETLLVCHACDVRYEVGDKTYRACCNPAHLWQGTQEDNVRDRQLKGRTARGDRNGAISTGRGFVAVGARPIPAPN